MPPRDALARSLPSVPPAAGAVVMGTGIVSIDFSLAGAETLSRILLGLDAVMWVSIGALLGARVAYDRAALVVQARSPAALTGVAGTAVLGTRLVLGGATWAGIVLLATALAVWLGLIGNVLRHWSIPTVGVSFVVTVSTESLAVLGATIALDRGAGWLLVASLVPMALGLVFYAFVVAHFDPRQLAVGVGDHWVAGGALAISALAVARIAIGARELGTLADVLDVFRVLAVVVWALALAWLPVLLAAEVRSPRWRYDVRRWSTVFPVGMYAACSFVVADATGIDAIGTFARVWTWPALAVWALVFAAMLERVVVTVRRAGSGADRQDRPPGAD